MGDNENIKFSAYFLTLMIFLKKSMKHEKKLILKKKKICKMDGDEVYRREWNEEVDRRCNMSGVVYLLHSLNSKSFMC